MYHTLHFLHWHERVVANDETHTYSEAVTSVKLPTSGPESHKIRWQLLVSNRDHVFTWKNTKPKTWKSTWTYRKKRTNLDCVCHPVTASLMQGRETLLCVSFPQIFRRSDCFKCSPLNLSFTTSALIKGKMNECFFLHSLRKHSSILSSKYETTYDQSQN